MSNITAGAFKGRRLVVPKGLRPTGAKVHLALFNILGDAVLGARVIDGFAGSGALGLEALSRGAAFAAFIESDTEAVLSIRENLERLDREISREEWRLLHMDLDRGLRQLAKDEAPFDFIFLDPPYRSDEGKKALSSVVDCAILAPAGWVAIEYHQRTVLPPAIGPLKEQKRHRYGDTVLSLYQASS